METVKEKIERCKILAELFLKEDKSVFIKDMENNFYFADIILVGNEWLTVSCFAPEQRTGKQNIPWASVVELKEYEEE